MSEIQILRCKRCGCPSVKWSKTNAGKWYLQTFVREVSSDPYARRMNSIGVPHRCETHATHSSLEEHQALYYATQERNDRETPAERRAREIAEDNAAEIAFQVWEDDANAAAFRAEMDRQYAMVGWTDEMAQAEREAEARAFLSDPDLRCGHEECDMEPCSLQGTLPRPPRGAALSEIRAWDKSQARARMARIQAREKREAVVW